MTSLLALNARTARATARPSVLDVVIARFAREHDQHLAPIVGCYLCQHNVALAPRALRLAA
jgi:hypothetical protein